MTYIKAPEVEPENESPFEHDLRLLELRLADLIVNIQGMRKALEQERTGEDRRLPRSVEEFIEHLKKL